MNKEIKKLITVRALQGNHQAIKALARLNELVQYDECGDDGLGADLPKKASEPVTASNLNATIAKLQKDLKAMTECYEALFGEKGTLEQQMDDLLNNPEGEAAAIWKGRCLQAEARVRILEDMT